MSQDFDPVSESSLKRLTGEFDLEGIMVLDLSDKGLTSYGSIPQCVNICVLNLSLNQLSSLSPLSPLTSLQHLDLSANQITTLDGVDKLESLKELNLAGNNIKELDTLLPLSSVTHLTHLTLSLPGSSLTNQVCSLSSYSSFIRESLPWLEWLDGEKVGGIGAEFYSKCDEIEQEYAQSVNASVDVDKVKGHQANLPDPLKDFSLTDPIEGFSDNGVAKLLSECSDTSGKIQRHIQALKTLVANGNT